MHRCDRSFNKTERQKSRKCILLSKGQSPHSSRTEVPCSPRPGTWFALSHNGSNTIGWCFKIKSGLDNSTRSSAFNRIKAKHLDFVACDPSDMSIKFAIELDDSSHKETKRMERDAFLNDAMYSAGIPLHRFAVKREYDPREVYDKFFPQQQAWRL